MVKKRPRFQHQGPAWRCKHGKTQLGWVSCTAYSMAMGIDRATGGATRPTGCEVRERTNDFVKGLSLDQVATVAADTYHVRVTVKSGPHAIPPEKAAVQCRLGRGFVLQGNADVLRDTPFRATKGAVNHAVWVNRVRGGTRQKPKEARVFDPAADGRKAPWGTAVKGPSWWPWETVLAFAASLRINDSGKKLGSGKMYAGFIDAPPTEQAAIVGGQAHPAAPDVILAAHAVRTKPFPDRMRADPPPGRSVNVRRNPRGLAPGDVVDTLSDGTLFIAFQRIDDGAKPGGSTSRTWYGNRAGNQWIHESGLRHIGGALGLDPVEVPLSPEPAEDTEDEDLVPGAEDLPVDVRDDDFEAEEFTAADLGLDPDADLPAEADDGEGDDEEDEEDEEDATGDDAVDPGQP